MKKTKIALITGSSQGIGAAIAKKLAQNGYFACINTHKNQKAALDVVHSIEKAGGKAMAICADVSDPSAVNDLFKTIDSIPGHLDALVNNAGTLSTQMRLDQMDITRWEHVFKHNVQSAFLCSKEAVLRMSTRHGGNGGAIVNISSASSYLGAPNEYIDYAATKGAIDSMTRGLALEVASEGIRVNAVRPALIQTNIHAKGGMPSRVDQKKHLIPLQRGGTAEEVAEACAFLLSQQSSFTTGTFINVSGGL